MPHVNSSGGDDLASTDEVKVYKDEGEDEKRSSENLSDEKLGLLRESEEGKTSDIDIEGGSFSDEHKSSSQPSQNAKGPEHPFGLDRLGLPMGYPMITPYPFPNGATVGHLGGNKVLPSPPHSLSPFYMYNNDHFSPPPAHMGIPPVHIDPKTGLPRHMYTLPPGAGQFTHPLYPEFSQVNWSAGPHGYPITAAGLRGPYPTSLSGSPLSRFSPPGLMHHPGLPPLPHPAIITPGPKQEILGLVNPESHRHPYFSHHSEGHSHHNGPPSPEPKSKIPRIKKPLNAFMLFMKEMRQQVIEECTLKESAAINQILGRRWHALDRSEQAKYYEMARKEKELHQQLYPGWSARDNYATHNKKLAMKNQKRKRDMMGNGDNKGWGSENSLDKMDDDCPNAKKCRARFGLDQQSSWCKPCRRKKKCIRFLEDGGMNSNGEDDDDDDDDEDDRAPSVGTAPSTTEGDSELGSPTMASSSSSAAPQQHREDHRHPDHPQASSSSQLGVKRDSPRPNNNNLLHKTHTSSSMENSLLGGPHPPPHHCSSQLSLLPPAVSAYPPLPPLYRPVPLRDRMLPPHHHAPGLGDRMMPPHPSSLCDRMLPPQPAPSLPVPGPHSLPPPSSVPSSMVLAT